MSDATVRNTLEKYGTVFNVTRYHDKNVILNGDYQARMSAVKDIPAMEK